MSLFFSGSYRLATGLTAIARENMSGEVREKEKSRQGGWKGRGRRVYLALTFMAGRHFAATNYSVDVVMRCGLSDLSKSAVA